MTEKMRSKDSFLDRKKCTLSPYSLLGQQQSEGKNPREHEAQLLTL